MYAAKTDNEDVVMIDEARMIFYKNERVAIAGSSSTGSVGEPDLSNPLSLRYFGIALCSFLDNSQGESWDLDNNSDKSEVREVTDQYVKDSLHKLM